MILLNLGDYTSTPHDSVCTTAPTCGVGDDESQLLSRTLFARRGVHLLHVVEAGAPPLVHVEPAQHAEQHTQIGRLHRGNQHSNESGHGTDGPRNTSRGRSQN